MGTTKWQKTNNGMYSCRGEKYFYYYNPDAKLFLVRSFALPPTKSVVISREVKNLETAKKIVKLLEM